MERFKQVTKNNEYVWMKVTNSLEMLLVSMWQLLLLLLYLTPFNHWLVFLLPTFLISYVYSLLFSFSWSVSVFCNSFFSSFYCLYFSSFYSSLSIIHKSFLPSFNCFYFSVPVCLSQPLLVFLLLFLLVLIHSLYSCLSLKPSLSLFNCLCFSSFLSSLSVSLKPSLSFFNCLFLSLFPSSLHVCSTSSSWLLLTVSASLSSFHLCLSLSSPPCIILKYIYILKHKQNICIIETMIFPNNVYHQSQNTFINSK